MTLQRGRNAVGRKPTPPENTPRLRLKPKAPISGYVDGAWWPHSDDLQTLQCLPTRCSGTPRIPDARYLI
jgi:hypothetical protein